MSGVTEKQYLAALRDPDNASDEALRVACPNRYIHRRLADPDSNYVVMAQRDLDRIGALAKKHGIYKKFKALDIEVVPYDIDTTGE